MPKTGILYSHKVCLFSANRIATGIKVTQPILRTIYNMSGSVVPDIQTRSEGESLYIRYNTAAHVVNGLKNDSSYEFIGEVILKINVV